MSFPPTRNTVNSYTCPQCANGPSVCGSGGNGQWKADDAQAKLRDSVLMTPLTNLVAGGMVDIEVYFTAPHMGHFVVELCANPGPTVENSCFERLERDPTDTRYGPYQAEHPHIFYLPENACVSTLQPTTPLKARFKIPAGVTSEHAILRWHWQTGNSCDASDTAAGRSAPDSIRSWSNTINGKECYAALSNLWISCGTDCPSPACAGEQFRTCSDVAIITGNPSDIITSGNASNGGSPGGDAGGSSPGGNADGSSPGGGNGGSDTGSNPTPGPGGNPTPGPSGNNNGCSRGWMPFDLPPDHVWTDEDIEACQREIIPWDPLYQAACEAVCVQTARDWNMYGFSWCRNMRANLLTECVRSYQIMCNGTEPTH